jgi:DNA adenine methylase
MAIMNQLRSPICWVGGKHYSAQFIIEHLPAAHEYDIFCDIFGGGANILLTKPSGKHLEVYNDLNDDLVNCWLHLRDHATEMQERLHTLPYARSLYYTYHKSLFDGTRLEPLERAVRWFYVLQSSFRASVEETPSGWSSGVTGLHRGQVGGYKGHLHAKSYHNTVGTLQEITARFRNVEIDCRDFEEVIKQYEQPYGLRTLIYADPPYIDAEGYYKSLQEDSTMFHQRLARVLNATPAMVALSYYDHPWLDELYPATKWRRVTWQMIKHSQRTKATRDKATELLLCNYPASTGGLWDSQDDDEVA